MTLVCIQHIMKGNLLLLKDLLGLTPNCSEEIFVVKKIKNTVPWTYVVSDLNDEEIVGSFYEKELEKLLKRIEN